MSSATEVDGIFLEAMSVMNETVILFAVSMADKNGNHVPLGVFDINLPETEESAEQSSGSSIGLSFTVKATRI